MNIEKLLKHTQLAQKRAYAPFSNYPVGCAILTNNEEYILGCNIESKVYPTTLCAERTAIFSAISQNKKKFLAMGVITKDGAYPCGSCRQIIHEFTGDIPIYIFSNVNNKFKITNIKKLLPNAF